MCGVWYVLVMVLAVPYIEIFLDKEIPYPGFKRSRRSIVQELKSVLVLLSAVGFLRVVYAIRDGSWLTALVWFVWVLVGFLLINPKLGLVYYISRDGDFVLTRSAKNILRVWAYSFVIAMLLADCLES